MYKLYIPAVIHDCDDYPVFYNEYETYEDAEEEATGLGYDISEIWITNGPVA